MAPQKVLNPRQSNHIRQRKPKLLGRAIIKIPFNFGDPVAVSFLKCPVGRRLVGCQKHPRIWAVVQQII